MMNKSVIDKLNEKADRLISEREKVVKKNDEKLKTARDAIEKAKQKIQVAQDQEDAEGYHKAKQELNEAEDMLEMYSNTLKSYDDIPMITDEEYETAVSQIMNEMNAVNLSEEKRIVTLVKELEKIKSENQTAIDHANTVLRKYQLTLHLGRDIDGYEKGDNVQSYRLKQFDNKTIFFFVNQVATNYLLKNEIIPEANANNSKLN